MISLAYLHPHIEWLESQDIDCSEWLSSYDIARQDLINQKKFIPALTMLEYLHEFKVMSKDPAMSFKVGSNANPRNWGLITPLLMNSPTIGQAIMYASDYEHLFNSALTTHFEMDTQWVICDLQGGDLPIDLLSSMVEQDIASTVNMLRFLMDKKHQQHPWVKEVNFKHGSPGDTQDYEDFFMAPVIFNTPHNRIIFDIKALDLPIRFADSKVLQSSLEQINQLAAMAESDNLQKRLTRYITEALPQGLPNINQASEHIGISPSTLKRRLQEENTNYQNLCSYIRKRQAQNLLQDLNNSLLDVALKLGYTDQPAFYRAFKSWHQCTPNAFREKLFN
jgi:AraC-like DNA-binding protein